MISSKRLHRGGRTVDRTKRNTKARPSAGEQPPEIQSQMMGWELARAYVPFQRYTTRFNPAEGLAKGTIFPELYMPYKKTER